MRTAGIDVGSRAIKVIALEDGRVLEARRAATTYDPTAQVVRLLHGLSWDAAAATGYGRKRVTDLLGVPSVTEIKAHARGAAHLFPDARTVLDIGGQDTKVIALGAGGRVLRFEMNDRCAAGTGRFIEFMAAGLHVPIEEFGAFALGGRPGTKITSMCTVFAESEATSLMAQGKDAADIALALHDSVVRRSLSMLMRVGLSAPLVFCGGVALNACVTALLAAQVGAPPLVPNRPEMVGALGAALLARDVGPC